LPLVVIGINTDIECNKRHYYAPSAEPREDGVLKLYILSEGDTENAVSTTMSGLPSLQFSVSGSSPYSSYHTPLPPTTEKSAFAGIRDTIDITATCYHQGDFSALKMSILGGSSVVISNKG